MRPASQGPGSTTPALPLGWESNWSRRRGRKRSRLPHVGPGGPSLPAPSGSARRGGAKRQEGGGGSEAASSRHLPSPVSSSYPGHPTPAGNRRGPESRGWRGAETPGLVRQKGEGACCSRTQQLPPPLNRQPQKLLLVGLEVGPPRKEQQRLRLPLQPRPQATPLPRTPPPT